jgi:hypothetical protein
MDGRGASGVFAVVSLPLQLATSAKQLFEFWDSVVGAPKTIENIAIELKLLSIVLDQIEARYQKRGLSGTILNVLNNCPCIIRKRMFSALLTYHRYKSG